MPKAMSAKTMSAVENRAPEQPVGGPLGFGSQYLWYATPSAIDMAMPAPAPVPVTIPCEPQNVIIDLERTAIVVIDMQNDFCAKGGWVDHLGVDYGPTARRSSRCNSCCRCCAKPACR